MVRVYDGLMPALVLVIVALVSSSAASLASWRLSRPRPKRPAAVAAGRRLARLAGSHPGLRAVLDRRLDPQSTTGLGLSVALLFTAGAGILLGLLAYLVRTNEALADIDNGAARWGERHASSASTHVLNGVTQLGSIYVVVGLCVVLAAAELFRTRSRWVIPFVVAVVGGGELMSTLIKHVVDRARPAFNPAAASLGPSFPSGHTTAAAAFYAAAALLLGRSRPRLARALLNGVALGIAMAVAASRVLLDVHWLTDVVGGLALGFAWFMLCAMAFGGRILRFGVVAEVAEAELEHGLSGPAEGGRRRDVTGRRCSVARGRL